MTTRTIDEPRLRAERLSLGYGSRTVVDGLDLRIPDGSFTVIVGANGSGKSTLVKILSGYHEPDRGSRVRFGDQIMEGHIHPAQARAAGVRFVHQDSRM